MLHLRESTLAVFLLASFFLLPDIPSFAGMPNVRFEDFIVLLVGFHFAFKGVFTKLPRGAIGIYFIGLFTFCIWILITIITNSRMSVIGDHFEFYKMFKYVVVCYLFFRLQHHSNTNKQVVSLFIIIFFVLFFFNLANLTNFSGFNSSVLMYYAPLHHIEAMGSEELGVTRLLGTMGNPNNNAILWGWLTAIFLVQLLVRHKHRQVIWIALFSSAMMTLLTQSRTTLIGLVFGYVILLSLTMQRKRFVSAVLVTALAGMAIYFVLDQFNLSYIRTIWELDLDENTSWLARLDTWNFLYGMVQQSYWLGHGPNKEFFYDNNLYAENEYLLMAWRYGVVGFALYTASVLFPWICACKIARNAEVIWAKVIVMMAPLLLVAAITNSPMSDPRLMLIYAAIVGMMFFEYKASDSSKNNLRCKTSE